MTIIDLSRLPPPNAVEVLDYETNFSAFKTRFLAAWDAERVKNPTLPVYDTEGLETDPAMIIGQAFSYGELVFRARINDAVKAVLAPLSTGADLDNIAAGIGVERLTIIPAVGDTPAVMETDAALLRRYLLAWGRPAAGSPASYMYHAFTALPILRDVAVIGRSVHGRRGDVDLVCIGPGGRLLTTTEIAAITTAVRSDAVKPEATSVTPQNATRVVYNVDVAIDVSQGPDPALVATEARARILAFGLARLTIGAEVPLDGLSGSAYGPNVLRATLAAPTVAILPTPYAIPVMGTVTVTPTVRS